MLTIKEIKKKAAEYAKKYYGSNQILFDLMFRKEDDKYYFGFLIIDLVDEEHNDYRIKRPTKWMLVDILTGDLIKIYDSSIYDYSDKKTFPFELVFDNNGSSSLYDYSNYILSSYFDWKNKVIKELKNKVADTCIENESEQILSNEKILRVNSENVTLKEFILANAENVLEELHEIIIQKIGDKVQEANLDYHEYIIDLIRKQYKINKEVDTMLLISYVDLLKYSWPDLIDLINAFDNITTTKNLALEKALKSQTEKKYINN